MNIHHEGDLVTVVGTFRNATGILQTPTAVFLDTREPSGLLATYTYGTSDNLTQFSEGVIHGTLDTTSKRGLWIYTFYSTGTIQSDSGERTFYVE
jgi:hypothetical protein